MPKRYKNMDGKGRLVRSTIDCIPEREAGSKCITHTTALAHELWDGCPLPQYDKLRDRPIRNTGYVADTYASAWHSVLNTDSFEDAISDAINRGGDADTVGAVTGMIAGRSREVPIEYFAAVKQSTTIKLCGQRCAALRDA